VSSSDILVRDKELLINGEEFFTATKRGIKAMFHNASEQIKEVYRRCPFLTDR